MKASYYDRSALFDRPEFLHSSPLIEGSGITRPFLAISEAVDHPDHARGPFC